MSSWLDTETKALLQESPPNKLAPPDTDAFTLVLLSMWWDGRQRLVRAIQRIRLGSAEDALRRLRGDLPIPIKDALTYADALLGQFELISCDAISVFFADDVFTGATQQYLDNLYKSLRQSDEFAVTSVRIEELPDDERGDAFIDQFLGSQQGAPPATVTVLRKKARIMYHWGNRIGGRVSVIDD